MYLTSTNVVHYLLARGIVTRQDVVHRPFSVFEIDGQHRSFRVTVGIGNGLFVKQLKAPSPTKIASLEREARSYRLAWSKPLFDSWQRVIPQWIAYDAERHVVIVERIADSEDFTTFHRPLKQFPVNLATRLGTALADVHNATSKLPRDGVLPFSIAPPWVLGFPHSTEDDLAPEIKHLAKAVGEDLAYSRQLEALRNGWSLDALIHGDLKWSNILVTPLASDVPHIRLVDWELANWGDPWWDVAGGMEGYFIESLLRNQDGNASQPDLFARGKCFEFVRPPIDAIWSAYRQRRGNPSNTARDDAIHCLRFVGARLLLAMIETHGREGPWRANLAPLWEASRTLVCEPAGIADALFNVGSG